MGVLDFEQLRIFMVLAEEGTFLGAANRLSTSRSRVRRKLDQLERSAGTALVSRAQSGLALTPAGEVLARRGRGLLEDAENLISHVHDVGNIPTGRLKVALPIGPPPAGWEQTRQQLQSRFPDLQIETFFSATPTGLLPGHAEIALTFEDEIPRGCNHVELGEFRMQLFVSDLYLGRYGTPASVDELSSHRVAMWRSSGRTPDRIPLLDGRALEIEPFFVSDEPMMIHRMTVAGDCIAYLPELPVLSDPSLKTLFGDQVSGSVRERLVFPNVLADVPRVQRFVELTQQSSPVQAL